MNCIFVLPELPAAKRPRGLQLRQLSAGRNELSLYGATRLLMQLCVDASTGSPIIHDSTHTKGFTPHGLRPPSPATQRNSERLPPLNTSRNTRGKIAGRTTITFGRIWLRIQLGLKLQGWPFLYESSLVRMLTRSSVLGIFRRDWL